MSEATLSCIKLAIALVGALAFYHAARRSNRWARAVLGGCAALAICAYFQFGRLPAGFVHRWEMFHYYVGSKYHEELGYKRLYSCALLADADNGLTPRPGRTIRDLENDGVIAAEAVLASPETCKSHFSAPRWQEFRRDVSFFHRGLGERGWEMAQLDHGYNPPPLWTAVWGELCQRVPATLPNLQLLAGIDLLAMVGVLGMLVWGFGWRVALLGVVFWGTQAASQVAWTGGGLARQDWLLLAVAGVALLRRQRFGAAGAVLALAGLLRLFPLVLVCGALAVWLAHSLQRRQVPRSAQRFVVGAALAACLAVGLSTAHGGAGDYREFWSHIQLRHDAIVNNHMGLRTLLASAPVDVAVEARNGTEPSWIGERRARLSNLRPVHAACVALVLLGALAALWQARRAWVGAALAVALIPLLTDPSNYYYSFFVVMVPLARRRPALGVLWCALAAGGQLLESAFLWPEQRYAALSWLYVGISILVVVAFIRLPRGLSLQRRRSQWATG